MQDRPNPRPPRVHLIWVVGIALGVAAGGAAAYLLASRSGPLDVASSR